MPDLGFGLTLLTGSLFSAIGASKKRRRAKRERARIMAHYAALQKRQQARRAQFGRALRGRTAGLIRRFGQSAPGRVKTRPTTGGAVVPPKGV